MTRVHRNIRLLGAAGKARLEVFRGAEHVVVPVTVLVEGVVTPVNVGEPELVLASEFGISPAGWDGRPVLPDHPVVDGKYVLANSPQLLEQFCFGSLFNTQFDGDRLASEAWLDPLRAEAVGSDAVSVVQRAQSGEAIEISAGFTALLEKTTGLYKGKRYTTISRNITPDHLAMLPEGVVGACSNKMGCGANVMNRGPIYLVTHAGLAEVEEAEVTVEKKDEIAEQKKSFRERFWDVVTFRGLKGVAAGVSDSELRMELNKMLRSVEPGFIGVEHVFPEDSHVIFSAMPGDKWQMFRRDYSVKSDGTVKIGDTREEVVPVTNFVAAQAAEEKQPGCGCATKQKEQNMDKALRIKALIDGSKGRFTDTDKPWLEAIPEDRLSALEQATPAQPVAQAAAVVEQPAKVDEKKPQTVEEFVSSAPAEIREVLQAGLQANKSRREAAIKALKDTQRCTFTDEQLARFSIEELESLKTLSAVPEPQLNHEGVVVAQRAKPATGVDAPPRLADRLKK